MPFPADDAPGYLAFFCGGMKGVEFFKVAIWSRRWAAEQGEHADATEKGGGELGDLGDAWGNESGGVTVTGIFTLAKLGLCFKGGVYDGFEASYFHFPGNVGWHQE